MPSSRPSPRPTEPAPKAARPDRWSAAVAHLIAVDDRWRPLIDRIGPCRLRPRPDRFGTLVRAIIGQQISSKAAASIDRRLLELQGLDRHTPETLLALGASGIRNAGLSGVKAAYVVHLAEAVTSGRVALDRIGRLSDSAIIEALTSIKGIGPWTAEMFLIFALNRPDVLPVGDLGVKVGIRAHYGLPELPKPATCIELAAPWRPFRTVAMWYLWRGIDTPSPPSPTS